ncbi:TetR/AcrR family transcriptional regulator [Anaerocolumna xylanovorans]|uniref:Transcriptional regulator, TetR family n=1 Tax=Anaerocolumna xylanovorans DSM 12503 TaxID=1121345 RepID=A0A1M7YM56_9FIRM|nr:TetR/AcrR family transcriptional regulator [Anaerocolumna xylanovorans]SHO53670.1 transcriptional regulator, TetR family [Anaerocolumna xylanovorans DSM 12503]
MAKQIEGVYEKVYECAKTEFLSKGFKDASLRTIALAAGTSTSSIYTRFHSKEGLFQAIVAPVVEEFKDWFLEVQESFHQRDADYQKKNVFRYSGTGAEQFVEYIYKHYDVFKLLLECAEGTEFSDFLNELVEIEMDYTVKYMDCTGDDVISNGNISPEFLHIVTSAYYSGIFEMVRHNMKKEDGMQYAKQLREFYYAGFAKIYQWES